MLHMKRLWLGLSREQTDDHVLGEPLFTPQQPRGFTWWDCLNRAGNITSSFFCSTFLAWTTL